jgi:hypothetical protein
MVKIVALLACLSFFSGCSSAEQQESKTAPRSKTSNLVLQVGITTYQDVEASIGKPMKYEGEAAEFGTVTWVYTDLKLYFKRGKLVRIERTTTQP